MSSQEQTGIRDLIYSAWHREDSISRFISLSSAKQMSMQDIDFVEYDYSKPIIFKEVGLDFGQSYKDVKLLLKTSRLCYDFKNDIYTPLKIPVLAVLYTPSDKINKYVNHKTYRDGLQKKIDEFDEYGGIRDIENFRVKCFYPEFMQHGWQNLSPREYAEYLCNIRFGK